MANVELSTFLKEIADAIRNIKGTSELINAQDFAVEINNFFNADTLQTFYVGTTAPTSSFGNNGDLYLQI